MKPGKILRVIAALFLILATPQSAPAASKLVMAYYMPWFAAKPYGTAWGWHWTMDHFNPDTLNAAGQRQIASWYYPLIGPYDSSDPAVLEYHVLLMKLAGIDGVIVDWYGSADVLDYGVNNQATLKLFEFTRKAGLKFSICYEDQTIQHMIDGGFLVPTDAISHARKEMLYLQASYFPDPSYLRLNGRPVLLNFGPQYFQTSANWDDIFSALATSNQPAFFTEDNRLPAGEGAFNWPPMWMSHSPGTGGVLSGAALRNYVADFEQKAAGWPTFISSAFPRFHDIYQKAGVRNYWGYLGDRHSETLRETLGHGMTNRSSIVQVVTWNDFGEGSMIEPTQEYGYRDLGILLEFRRKYLDSSFNRSTNDLPMALKFYNLRQKFQDNRVASSKLDHIFADMVAGKIDSAKFQLNDLAK